MGSAVPSAFRATVFESAEVFGGDGIWIGAAGGGRPPWYRDRVGLSRGLRGLEAGRRGSRPMGLPSLCVSALPLHMGLALVPFCTQTRDFI